MASKAGWTTSVCKHACDSFGFITQCSISRFCRGTLQRLCAQLKHSVIHQQPRIHSGNCQLLLKGMLENSSTPSYCQTFE